MEWKVLFAREDERCQKWRGVEYWGNGMEDGLRLFHVNFNIQLFTKLFKTKVHESAYIISLLELKQYIYFCFELKQLPTDIRCQQQLVLFSHIVNYTVVQSFNLHFIATDVSVSVKNCRITSSNKNRNFRIFVCVW